MADKIYIQLEEEVFDRVKDATELKSRMMPELSDQIIATDSEIETFRYYFTEFATEFMNETASFDQLYESEGQMIYTLTDKQSAGGMKYLRELLIRLVKEYLLYRWYSDLGIGELAGQQYATYDNLLKQWMQNNSQTKFVTPTYRPYF